YLQLSLIFLYTLTPFFILSLLSFFFFFNDTATTEIYTLSLHDALPICSVSIPSNRAVMKLKKTPPWRPSGAQSRSSWETSPSCRSEEHTSELQSRGHLVCRLLLEKKKKKK